MPVLATLAVAAAGVGAVMAIQGREDARHNANQAADQGRMIQSEQVAKNAQAAANERRQQIREERVRQAKIIQASTNTGVSGSSGEFGAIGSLSTQLDANLGSNLGSVASGQRISQLAQSQADFNLAAQNAQADMALGGSIFQLGTSLFSASGGFKTKPPPKP